MSLKHYGINEVNVDTKDSNLKVKQHPQSSMPIALKSIVEDTFNTKRNMQAASQQALKISFTNR